ncbi:MAG: hypothetical protein NT176_14235 [Proteobacteria bacterium]|nr:hypothetical protein [Pseudomonadota bacterium]
MTISGGVPAGANAPNQTVASNPGYPSSVIAGTFGMNRERSSEVAASTRSRPSLIVGPTTTRSAIIVVTRPPSRSGSACE